MVATVPPKMVSGMIRPLQPDARVNDLGGRNGAPKQLHSDMCLLSLDNIYLRSFSIRPTEQ